MHTLPERKPGNTMSAAELSGRWWGPIMNWRLAIRSHRDATGDDRCWITDYLVWAFLSDTEPLTIKDQREGMLRCREFFQHRRASQPDVPPPDAREFWTDKDHDIVFGTDQDRLAAIQALTEATRAHRDLPPSTMRTADHDRALYRVLPEKTVADFRLTPMHEFLGTSGNTRASCPNFWRSHEDCPQGCSLHLWGPTPVRLYL